jgi:cell wall-associated NlpC family hydrolase
VERLPRVPLDRLRPGDIVWRPGHVGLYLGAGQVINATKPGDVVKIQRLEGYIKAVRPY